LIDSAPQVYDLSLYFDGVVDSYTLTGIGKKYASISGSVMTLVGDNRGIAYEIIVTATNSVSQVSSTLDVIEYPAIPSVLSQLGEIALIDSIPQVYDLALYFDGLVDSYTFTVPDGNVRISDGILTIISSYSNTSYEVAVTANNVTGSATSTLKVTEPAVSALIIKTDMGSITLIDSIPKKINLALYFGGFVESYTMSDTDGNVIVSKGAAIVSKWFMNSLEHVLYLTGTYTSITYDIVLTATNKFGSISSTLTVTDNPALPKIIAGLGSIALADSTPRTYDLVSYFGGVVDSYTLTGPEGNVIGVSSSGGSEYRLTILGDYRGIEYNLIVTASNVTGFTSSTLKVRETPPLPFVIASLGSLTLANSIPQTFDLTLYFGGVVDSYTLTDPEGNAIGSSDLSVSNSILTIVGDYRGMTYDVLVNATNETGATTSILKVTENPDSPVILLTMGSITLASSIPQIYDLDSYFGGVVDSYTLTGPEGNVIGISSVGVSGSILTIVGDYRDIEYDVIVTASNVTGSISSTLTVIETPPVPTVLRPLVLITLIDYSPRTYDLIPYFGGLVDSYTLTDPEGNDISSYYLSISGSVLTVIGTFKGVTYDVFVLANNTGGSATSTWIVTENPPAPTVTTTLGDATLPDSTPRIYNLASYFGGFVDSYTLTDPDGNVIGIFGVGISESVLTIAGDYRGTIYEVVVTANNVTGSATSTLIVTENPSVPVVISELGSVTLTDSAPRIYDLISHFGGVVDSYTLTDIEGNVIGVVSESIMTVVGSNRGVTYYIVVTARNITGSISSTLKVTETHPAPTALDSLGFVTLSDSTPQLYDLSLYFDGIVDSYTLAYPDGNVIGVSSLDATEYTLAVVGDYRGKTYDIVVTAWNVAGSVASTLTVTENPVVPVLLTPLGSITLVDSRPQIYNLASYFGGVIDIYELMSDYDNVDISRSILTITGVGSVISVVYEVIVVASNATGSITSTLYVTENAIVSPVRIASLGSVSIFDYEPRTYDLTLYFSGYVDSYTIHARKGRATISEYILTVTGDHRGITYDVIVTASNVIGSVSSTLTVTEDLLAPIVMIPFGSITLIDSKPQIYDLDSYFGGLVDSYTLTDPDGNDVSSSKLSVSEAKLIVIGACRGVTYSVTVTAINVTGSVASTLEVTESNITQPIIKYNLGSITLVDSTPQIYDLTSYFGGFVESYTLNIPEDSVVGISDDELTIVGNNSGTSYSVIVTANNAFGSVTSTLYVTESPKL
jgi:hypothetical protein